MKLLKGLFKGITIVAQVAVPAMLTVVTPEGLINLAAGAVMKHAIPRLPNNTIPYISMAGSVAVDVARNALDGDPATGLGMAVTEGIRRAASAWATHLSIKQPLANRIQVKGQTL